MGLCIILRIFQVIYNRHYQTFYHQIKRGVICRWDLSKILLFSTLGTFVSVHKIRSKGWDWSNLGPVRPRIIYRRPTYFSHPSVLFCRQKYPVSTMSTPEKYRRFTGRGNAFLLSDINVVQSRGLLIWKPYRLENKGLKSSKTLVRPIQRLTRCGTRSTVPSWSTDKEDVPSFLSIPLPLRLTLSLSQFNVVCVCV